MRSSHRFSLTFISVAVFVAGASAQDAFVKITSPKDEQRFDPGTTIKVVGYMQVPEKRQADWLVFRFRVYRPDKKEFIIDAEDISRAKGQLPGKIPFDAKLKLPKADGPYLLKVDCLNVEPGHEGIIASQSIFIHVAPGKGNTVTIGSPSEGAKYGTGSDIGVTGSSTDKVVVKIRLRFEANMVIYQEQIVDVQTGAWTGKLTPPMGGWPVGTATIKAQGLDSGGVSVVGEFAEVGVVIKTGM